MKNINLNNREMEMVLMALSKLDVTDMREEVKELYLNICNQGCRVNDRELDLILMSLSKLDCTKDKYETKELYLNIVNQVNDMEFKKELQRNNKKEICNLR